MVLISAAVASLYEYIHPRTHVDSNSNFITIFGTMSGKEILWRAELLGGEIYRFQSSTRQIRSCMLAINSKFLSYRRI